MALRADVLEVARVLDEAARANSLAGFQPPPFLGDDAQVYAKVLRELARQKDIPGALGSAAFKPLLLQNGLILAASIPRRARKALLEGLAAGLREFVDHFEGLAETPRPAGEEALARQRRYLAFCLAQLIECGLPFTGALATARGDCLDKETAEAIRSWISDGPDVMLSSPLIGEKERVLWKDAFTKGRDSWPILRDYLAEEFSLPVHRLPET